MRGPIMELPTMRSDKMEAGEHVILGVTPDKTSTVDATEAVNPLVLAAWKTLRRVPGL